MMIMMSCEKVDKRNKWLDFKERLEGIVTWKFLKREKLFQRSERLLVSVTSMFTMMAVWSMVTSVIPRMSPVMSSFICFQVWRWRNNRLGLLHQLLITRRSHWQGRWLLDCILNFVVTGNVKCRRNNEKEENRNYCTGCSCHPWWGWFWSSSHEKISWESFQKRHNRDQEGKYNLLTDELRETKMLLTMMTSHESQRQRDMNDTWDFYTRRQNAYKEDL